MIRSAAEYSDDSAKRWFFKQTIPGSNGCLFWLGSIDQGGYGIAHYKSYQWQAHRMAWIIAYGLIPHGLGVHHLCGVRNCVNIDHLMVGSQRANNLHSSAMKRAIQEGAGLHRALTIFTELMEESIRIDQEGLARVRKLLEIVVP